MKKGVPVLAASNGVVTATRDGVNDINVKEIGVNTVDKIGCGNAAVISLGNGWTTVYCHMRKASVTVKKGDHVSTGQRIGYVDKIF
jgi:murein DD-endopeptidase MepM/ murein hydrolase activator NlpD